MAKRQSKDKVVAAPSAPKTAPVQIAQEIAAATTVVALRAALSKLMALLGDRR